MFQVKTAHARFPKNFLEDEMKDMPGGCWIVLEGKAIREEVDLVAIGYKYNKKRVLLFVTTKGAGSTKSGEPYKAKYNDAYGNVLHRDVPRPIVLNRYFSHCNGVDVHNQVRQHNLALEECWVTSDGYFRQWTTFVGITVTDLWYLKMKGSKRNRFDLEEEEDSKKIIEFADKVVFSLLEKAQTFKIRDITPTKTCIIINDQGQNSEISGISSDGSMKVYKNHTRVFLSRGKRHQNENNKNLIKMCGYKKGGQARCIWCSRVHNKKNVKTQLLCAECGFGFCNERSGNTCWDDHVHCGGVPTLVRKTKRRKLNI